MTKPLMLKGRRGGVLVPLFSIPTRESWGIGEIGDLPVFAAWLRSAGQSLLQLLPINEMAVGQRSPYSAMTAMAIDPIFISVHKLPEFAALGGEQGMDAEWRSGLDQARRSPRIDYGLVRGLKEKALRAAFAHFLEHERRPASRRAEAFGRWAADQAWWLDDYALFRALHAREDERAWTDWPQPLRDREPAPLAEASRELEEETSYRRWLQWVADIQWHVAKEAIRPVALLGDLPFMVDGDSADVWANAPCFRLDASVGAPPDAFSETGQNWGLPVYRWERMAESGYPWLRARARRSASLYDGYRVDHLVGFYRTYVFPKDEAEAFFTPSEEDEQLQLGETVLRLFAEPGARIIAEDLGTVPDFVRASLARLQVPGYKVLRWEREWDEPEQPFRDPSAYPPISVAASGTHDTETMAEWWESLDEDERAAAIEVPGLRSLLPGPPASDDGTYSPELRDALLELLVASGSELLLLPVQDIFGWRDRINVPASQGEHNWAWRMPWPADSLAEEPQARERAEALARWSRRHGRM